MTECFFENGEVYRKQPLSGIRIYASTDVSHSQAISAIVRIEYESVVANPLPSLLL